MKPLSDTQKLIFAMALMFLAMGFVTGPDDFDNAIHAQKVMCERHPKPEYCRGVK